MTTADTDTRPDWVQNVVVATGIAAPLSGVMTLASPTLGAYAPGVVTVVGLVVLAIACAASKDYQMRPRVPLAMLFAGLMTINMVVVPIVTVANAATALSWFAITALLLAIAPWMLLHNVAYGNAVVAAIFAVLLIVGMIGVAALGINENPCAGGVFVANC